MFYIKEKPQLISPPLNDETCKEKPQLIPPPLNDETCKSLLFYHGLYSTSQKGGKA